MATTFSKQSASQYSLKYQVTSDGSSVSAAKTAAQLIADCAAGPLKAFLGNLNAKSAGAFAAIAGGVSPLISVYNSSNGAGSGIAAADFSFAPNAFTAVGAAGAGVAIVEIRFHQSSIV